MAAPTRIYAHCDGPRSQVPGESERVAEVRRIIRDKAAGFELHTLFREANYGLRDGVYDAINWFFRQETRGIILEDDCLPDISMFRFCEELLLKYQDDDAVMHIGCSNLSESVLAGSDSSYMFSRFSFIWGWATWRRAWEKIDFAISDLDNYTGRYPFGHPWISAGSQAYLRAKFQDTRMGKNRTWDYQWFYSILINNGLCIVPKTNLVQNIGIGEAGATNTTGNNVLARKAAGALRFPMHHPKTKSVDPRLEQQFFYDSQKGRFRLWIWSMLRFFGLR